MLDSIRLSAHQTECFLTVINESTEGTAWFCADSKIILTELDIGKRHQLLLSEGIPTCPDAYKFNYTGEKLSFKLVFPPLQNTQSEIDIIENCSNNCFSLKGIILDPLLNKEIRSFEYAVRLFNEKKLNEALPIFLGLIDSKYVNENHFAYTLYIIPVIYEKLGQQIEAKKAYHRLVDSKILNKNYFIERLQQIDFFRSL